MLTTSELETLTTYGELANTAWLWLWTEIAHGNKYPVAGGMPARRAHSLNYLTGAIRRKCRHLRGVKSDVQCTHASATIQTPTTAISLRLSTGQQLVVCLDAEIEWHDAEHFHGVDLPARWRIKMLSSNAEHGCGSDVDPRGWTFEIGD